MAFCTLKGAGFEALEAKDGPKALGGLATIRVDLTSTDGASRPIAVNA
ncbi:MAG: hypothetical protein H6Q99_2340 [Proteobacteria bacterium]|nr:hypothetical protein [Pseudomonadota bacterium]